MGGAEDSIRQARSLRSWCDIDGKSRQCLSQPIPARLAKPVVFQAFMGQELSIISRRVSREASSFCKGVNQRGPENRAH